MRVQPSATEDGEIGSERLHVSRRAAMRWRCSAGPSESCAAAVLRLDGVAGRGCPAQFGVLWRLGRSLQALQLPCDAAHLPADLVGHGRLAVGRLALAGHGRGSSPAAPESQGFRQPRGSSSRRHPGLCGLPICPTDLCATSQDASRQRQSRAQKLDHGSRKRTTAPHYVGLDTAGWRWTNGYSKRKKHTGSDAQGARLPIEILVPRARLCRRIADPQLIDRGESPAGRRLPTEPELARKLGVSRLVVREASVVSEAEEHPGIEVGSATRVIERPIRHQPRRAPRSTPITGPFEPRARAEEEGPAKGALCRSANSHNRLMLSVAVAPASYRLAVQIYVQALRTRMIAKHAQGEPIERTLAWALDEPEGLMRT
jgi:hypothetical protein